eukprot:CAMPEP_0118973828 /NCGR_PEP_ID=MMETSP1173-20130426/10932_1 /TAXON_ID=1034831 /ORGANISM="Rhizochromulina marina cf, Strain CCMP1243" /LENGTH=67 /DNA_ID=CAMNT_0006923523 /DNA_START=18 /DNA_END=221 /DNA_ORIENTATION=-
MRGEKVPKTSLLGRWYYRWELLTGIYMMDWWEKVLCNSTVAALFVFSCYSFCRVVFDQLPAAEATKP